MDHNMKMPDGKIAVISADMLSGFGQTAEEFQAMLDSWPRD